MMQHLAGRQWPLESSLPATRHQYALDSSITSACWFIIALITWATYYADARNSQKY